MVASPAAADAVRRARALPGLRVGLHVVLVEARPALPAMMRLTSPRRTAISSLSPSGPTRIVTST